MAWRSASATDSSRYSGRSLLVLHQAQLEDHQGVGVDGTASDAPTAAAEPTAVVGTAGRVSPVDGRAPELLHATDISSAPTTIIARTTDTCPPGIRSPHHPDAAVPSTVPLGLPAFRGPDGGLFRGYEQRR
jgi:hypothetical protein